jgi:WD40 repeat protein
MGRVWDVRTGDELVTLAHSGGVATADFSPDGDRVATGSANGTAKVWDARSGEELLSLSVSGGAVGEVKFSPDGRTLITGGTGATRVWDVTPEGRGESLSIATPSGSFLVAYGLGGSVLVSADDTGTYVWDATSGDRLDGFPREGDLTGFVTDDRRVLVSADPPVIRVDNTGEMRATYPPTELNELNVAAYSPDGSVLASGHLDGRLLLWDAETGAQIAALAPASDRQPSVNDLAFSPDGSRLVSASSGAAKVWDLQTDRVIRRFAHADAVSSVAFSPDGALVATGSEDGSVRIWELEGERVIVLAGHQGAVNSVQFSPDGTRVATSSQDQTIRLWDVETGREVLILRGNTSSVGDAAFSPDGVHLASAGYDGTVREYVLPIEALIELAESRLTRTWTQEECRQYVRLETCPAA